MPPKTKPVTQAKAAVPKKWTPRPARPASERLPKLYRALADQVNDGYFDNAKKTCRKILALDAESKPAFQTLLFLLLHTDDYASALTLVESTSSPSTDLRFEHAYCLYRLQREREALTHLRDLPRSPKVEHLEAQISYRLGEYETAEALYDNLLAESLPQSEREDIRVNVEATRVQTAFIEEDFKEKLNTPAVVNDAGVTNAPQDRERDVPTLPSGWARGAAGVEGVKKEKEEEQEAGPSQKKERTKPRHKLPQGVKEGDSVKVDPERWVPMRQRASYVPKKGKKETTGLGTQGGLEKPAGGNKSGGGSGGGGGGGGGKNKKKGKKK